MMIYDFFLKKTNKKTKKPMRLFFFVFLDDVHIGWRNVSKTWND